MEKSDIPSARRPKDASVPRREAARDNGQLSREKEEAISTANAKQCEAFKKTLEESLAK
jgi:hypothetical protein